MGEPTAWSPVVAPLEWRRPPGWSVKTQVTLLSPDGRCNVIASTEPLDDDVTLDDFADTQGRMLREQFPGFDEKGTAVTTLEGIGAAVVLREFTWDPEGADPVRQLQLYAVRDGTGITATATCTDAEHAAWIAVMEDALAALVVRGDALQTNRDAAGEPTPAGVHAEG